MYNDKKVLAIIPARGGSKGIPRKNVRNLAGKPLIAWTIEEAKKSNYIDRLILSSEDEEIIAVAKKHDCEVPFVRPACLSKDETPGIAPVLHALEELPGYDYVVLLQPTSPLRTVTDIDGCIKKLIESNSPACVSVTESQSSPYWMYTINDYGNMKPLVKQDSIILRRQELPQAYSLNGAVYIAKTEWIKSTKSFITEQTIAFQMPQNRSYDIDTEVEFLWCDWLINHNKTL